MKINKLIVLGLFLGLPLLSEARVREMGITKNEMGKVYLKMGKSTVLRFKDKPKKVVIGNQNYFNVEFIDNDVTIQPLGNNTTNLFVYGESQTYGLILNVVRHNNYDDLVVVKRSYPQVNHSKRPSKKRPELNFGGELENKLKITGKGVLKNATLGFYILDLSLKNLGSKTINTDELEIKLTRSNKSLKDQEVIFERQKLVPKDTIRSRVLFKTEPRSFTLWVKHNKKEWKYIVRHTYL